MSQISVGKPEFIPAVDEIPAPAPAPLPQAPPAAANYALVNQIGIELSGPINKMRAIAQLAAEANPLSSEQARDLLAAIESANQIARQSQQIARLADGHLRQSHERLHLDQLLLQALDDLAPTLQAMRVTIQHNIKPVEIMVDPGLLFSLIDASLKWGLENGQRLLISLRFKNWPEHGVFVIKAFSSTGQDPEASQEKSLNSHLLTHIAQTMGVTLEQEVKENGKSILQLEFAQTVRVLEGLTTPVVDTHGDSSVHKGTKPMAGLRILLISNDSLVCGEVAKASRLLSVTVDTVPTVHQALRYVAPDLPHLIIIDERLRNEEFERLVGQLKSREPNLGFLEIADHANTFEISSWMEDSMTRVSRDALRAQLPSLMTLELSRTL